MKADSQEMNMVKSVIINPKSQCKATTSHTEVVVQLLVASITDEESRPLTTA